MRASLVTITLATMALLQTSTVSAAAPITVQLVDATNFCTFLPPANSEDRNIASTEYIAEAFCMGNTPNAMAAGKLADGFIQSAHYLATDNYVQVTGQIDPSKMNLNVTDEGGQYDIAMPKGAVCADGWKHFVNLIEPAGNTYCLRCCHSKVDCNRGISEKGCAHIVPGDYSGPLDGSGPTNPPNTPVPPPPSQPSSSTPPAGGPSSSVPVPSQSAPPPPLSSAAGASSASNQLPSSSPSPSSSPTDDESVSAQSVDGDKSSATAMLPSIGTATATLVLLASLQHLIM